MNAVSGSSRNPSRSEVSPRSNQGKFHPTCAEESASASEELSSQAEQLQAAISYFRIDTKAMRIDTRAPAAASPKAEAKLRDAVMTKAPHMQPRKTTKVANSGGFDLDLDDSQDDLDGEFARRGAA